MIKGVNKLIVEINNPDSDYFERAIFFVKPMKSDTSTAELSNRAGSLIKNMTPVKNKSNNSIIVRKKKKSYLLLKLAGAAFAGGAVMAVIIQVF